MHRRWRAPGLPGFCILLLAATVLVLVVPAPAALVTLPATHVPSRITPRQFDEFDRDGDRIDDRLPVGGTPVDVFVRLEPGSTEDSSGLVRFQSYGRIRAILPEREIIGLGDVPRELLLPLAGERGVLLVEWAPPVVPLLDVAVPSIRAGSSAFYPTNVKDAWGYNGTGVVVAVLDTGVDDVQHTSLDDQDDVAGTTDPKFSGGYDATTVFNISNPDDTDGHGTHVAGIAVGTGGGTAFDGAAPRARLVDVKVASVFGSGTSLDFVEGLTWVRANAAVLNITLVTTSIGSIVASNGTDTMSLAVNDAVLRSGLVVVAAVGNDGPNNNGIPAPAAADEAIAVGATDERATIDRADDLIASFSNRGPRGSDGDANGRDELKPDVVAPGVKIMSARHNTPGTYIEMGGTSQAAPHVAGTVALMLQANGALPPRTVKQILHEMAEARGAASSPGLDPRYNTTYGWGIVDAYGAVARARDLRSGTVSAPSTVAASSVAAVTSRFTLTRTEFDTLPANVTLNVTIPKSWGEPQGITLDTGGAVAATTGAGPASLNLTSWTVSGWVRYHGTVNSVTTLKPVLRFTTTAPPQEGNATFTASWTVNGMAGTGDSIPVQVGPPGQGLADFAVEDSNIDFSDPSPAAGVPVTITALVDNLGTTGGFANVSFTDGPPQSGVPIGVTVVNVAAGAQEAAQVQWVPAGGGTHDIWVVVDPSDTVVEQNEKNNEAHATVVVSGANSIPTADLVVDPSQAGEGTSILLDAANSSDADGAVVRYNFTYGDGNFSGWVTTSQVRHTYAGVGLFDADLEVQDNGGAVSANDASVAVSIAKVKTQRRSLFLEDDAALAWDPPQGASPSRAPVPNGCNPPFPGLPCVVAETAVGTWTSPGFSGNATASGTATASAWIENAGTDPATDSVFRFVIRHGSTVIGDASTAPTLIDSGATVKVSVDFNVSSTSVLKGETLALDVRAQVRVGTLDLLYAAAARDSSVAITFTSFVGAVPTADAGPDRTVRVDETVQFSGTGADADGFVVRYEWDFEGDGRYDRQSPDTGGASFTYPAPGTFNATLRVTDNDGDQATDAASITVKPQNRAPSIRGSSPAGAAVELVVGDGQDFSVDATDPDNDPLTVRWVLDSSPVHTGPAYRLEATTSLRGVHRLFAEVSDGTVSVNRSWNVSVVQPNRLPVIQELFPENDSQVVSIGDIIDFYLIAADPDGDPLTGVWLVDGQRRGNGTNFSYEALLDDLGPHTVRGEVSDGKGAVGTSWSVSVVRANRAPTVVISSPLSGDAYYTTSQILFDATGRDADGDALTYLWTSNRSGTFGNEPTFSATLKAGVHRITVTVSDGKAAPVKAQVEITVTELPKGNPELGAAGSVVAAILVIFGILFTLVIVWRRFIPPRDYGASAHEEELADYDAYEEYGDDREYHEAEILAAHDERARRVPPRSLRRAARQAPADRRAGRRTARPVRRTRPPVRRVQREQRRRSDTPPPPSLDLGGRIG